MASNSEGGKPSQISAREALNVLPNTATVKDTAALDAYQEQETAAGNRPAPKKFYEHTDGETAFWKKAVIGGAVVALVVAGGLRLKKAADEGEIDVDDAKHKIKRKGSEIKGATKDALHKGEDRVKEAGSWAQDKTRDVLDVTGGHGAVDAAGDKLREAKDATKEKAHEVKEKLQHKEAEAEHKGGLFSHNANKEAHRMADKTHIDDNGFLGWKKWFGQSK